jgi:Tetracyclin repressor-like, C-terminal domain
MWSAGGRRSPVARGRDVPQPRQHQRSVHARDRRLHRVLFEESPRPASLLAELRDLEDAIVAQLAARLACHPPVRDPELSARITVATIESLGHRLVASDRPLDLDRFVDEATTLITSYLDC